MLVTGLQHIVHSDDPNNNNKKLRVCNNFLLDLMSVQLLNKALASVLDLTSQKEQHFVMSLLMLKAMHQVLLGKKHQPISS